MEASSLVMGSTNPCFSKGKDAGISAYSHKKPCLMMGFGSSSCLSRGIRGRKQLDFGFYDKGQLEFYDCNRIRCGDGGGGGKREKVKEKKGKEEKKMMKKSLKLLKGLSTDMSMFSKMMGVGLDDDHVKDEAMSEAAELLLGYLQKLRAEKKELKKKKKEEKKSLLRAARLQNPRLECDKSSSSSSESSDSECDREVVSMSRLKSNSFAAQPISSVTTPVIEKETVNSNISTIPCTLDQEENTSMVKGDDQVRVSNSIAEQECCSKTSNCCKDVSSNMENRVVTGLSSAKIEVCMGGKCKKSGAASLLEEFQKMVGVDVAVSGCKCMGKCKDGPNVKVVNNTSVDMFAGDVRTPSNPLCIGVGLEDVGLIVANFFGDNLPNKEIGFSAAATAAAGGASP